MVSVMLLIMGAIVVFAWTARTPSKPVPAPIEPA
jgi:hypothetical protein